MKNIHCLLLFVLITFSTFGQKDAWYHYTVAYTSSAFPGYMVHDIDIDQKNNVWFGTGNAVSIFDGSTFTNLWDANTRRDNWVIFSASDGSVWTGTYQGVFRVKENVWTHFTTADGLINTYVWDIEEDQSGNIWIGTSGGLTKYDGTGMVSYKMEDGLNHNHVEALHVDSSNRVWIGTEGGINTFDGNNWTSFTTEDGLPENFIREIDMDSLHRIWVGTNESGYAMYNDTVWTVYDTINDIPFLHGWALECDYEGNIWIGETGALGTFDGSQWTTLTSTDGMTNSFVRSIKAAEDGAIWIGTSSGATRYKEGLFTPYIPDGLSADRVYAFVEGAAQEYWFGTTRSLSFYDGTHWENYRSSDGLPCSNVLSMIKDHAGNLWLGTGCGVGKYDGDQFTQFTSEIGLSKLRIRAVFEDADNNIWVGSEGGGVAKYDGLDWSTFTTDNGLPDNNVYSICQDTADNIWVGTFGGVCYFDGSDWTSYTTSDGLPDNDITSVRSGPDGTLWIGTFGGGICTWDDGSFAQTTFENANSNYVWCISFVNDNELWVGTYGGIEIFDGDSWTNQSFPGTSNGIHCIDEDEAGNIWVCMKDNGVFRYGGAITKVREVHSSPIEVEVFPNPANETISIHIKSIFKPHFTARVFSLDGKLVASYGLLSKQSEIDISKLSSGMYLLYVTDDGGRFITSRKFFKY